MFKRLRGNAGMTLIEIMIVLVILATVGTLAVTKLMPNFEKSKVKTTEIQMGDFKTALQLYFVDNNAYPTTEQGLEALVQKPTVGPDTPNYNAEGYLSLGKGKTLKDAWGNPFIYESDGTKYTIKSYGRDGKEGGEGNDTDIVVESE